MLNCPRCDESVLEIILQIQPSPILEQDWALVDVMSYFKNNGFCFIDENGNGISFTQEDFVDLMYEFDSNFIEIIDEWTRRNAKQAN